MNTFFTSDTHFYHKNILDYCKNRLDYCSSVDEMNEVLIKKWNEKVKDPTDRVFHIGDFAFSGWEKAKAIFDKLNGKKILVKGNHDNMKNMKRLGWESIFRSLVISIGKQKITLAHQPEHLQQVYSDGEFHISFGLCGHVHEQWKVQGDGNLIFLNRKTKQTHTLTLGYPIVNIGIDVWDGSPVSENELFSLISNL